MKHQLGMLLSELLLRLAFRIAPAGRLKGDIARMLLKHMSREVPRIAIDLLKRPAYLKRAGRLIKSAGH